MARIEAAGLVVVCAVCCANACADPVRDDQIAALGPEEPGVPEGPLHRPGQPCVAPCHDRDGPADSVFSVAGTVFQTNDRLVPLSDAILHFIDSTRLEFSIASNCAGNFFIDERDYTPIYPLWVTIEFGGLTVPMTSPIFREGGCAVCHLDPAGEASAGHVYLIPGPFDFPPSGCP
jgi:hypothetical protein